MILFLYGTDTFRSRQHLTKMIEKFRKDRDPEGLNVSILDGEKETSSKILEQISASPFLAEKRMVVVERLLSSKQKDLMEIMLKKIEERTIPPFTILVFWEEGDTFKTKDAKALAERLKAEKYAQEFAILEGPKLQAWVAAEVNDRGGHISHEAVRFLIEHIGGDMWRLNSVIDQLVSFVTRREIAVADVEKFVQRSVDDNIFSLIDAITSRDSKRIYPLMEEQYAQGNDAGYLFAMMLRQFRILLELKDVIDRTGERNDAVIAKQLGIHPFVAKKSMPLVAKYSMEDLKTIYRELLKVDIGTKTGGGDQKTLLDLFIARLCS